MEKIELELRRIAGNRNGAARSVLQDYLEDLGRLDEMPVCIEPFRAYLNERYDGGYDRFQLANGWIVSVQASPMHYCSPKTNRFVPPGAPRPPVSVYVAWECAVRTKHEVFHPISKDERIPAAVRSHAQGDIIPFLPTALVQELLNAVERFDRSDVPFEE